MPPRRTSQAVKKDTATIDVKNEENAPRRSGRAVSKPESAGREASRSRRSSTAAQTAASVADSKTPKGRSSVSSRRESTSPSDTRTRTGRDGVESPATRVKSTRRSTGRINYKESDGEEEVQTPKYDEAFDSGDEFEDSESDENSKTRGKGKTAKSPAKSHSTTKSKPSARSRRGRPNKKKGNDDEDQNETVDVSDDSVPPEEVPVAKKGKTVKQKEPPKPARSRRQRSEVTEVKPDEEEKPKPSRRSGRASLSKDESSKKRPSRSVQAKKYTEEDDDIEEISDSKADEDDVGTKKEGESRRKRKRGESPDEANKRLKEDEAVDDDEDVKEIDDKDESGDEKQKEEKSVEEPMEVDEAELAEASEDEKKLDEVKKEKAIVSKTEEVIDVNVGKNKEKQEDCISPPKEKLNETSKQDSVDSSENLDESMHSSNSEPESKVEPSVSSGLDDSQDAKEILREESKPDQISDEDKSEKPKADIVSPSSESSKPTEDKTEEIKNLPSPAAPEIKTEEIAKKVEVPPDSQTKHDGDTYKNDNSVSEDSKPLTIDETSNTLSSPGSIPVTITQPKETNQDATFNRAEKNSTLPNSAHGIQSATNASLEHSEKSTPTENGAHNDVQHTNSTSTTDKYYLLPGRKYVSNSKLNESVRQSIKNQTFGFVSYNLGTSSSDAYLQKDKLLNELNNLEAHVICLQQVTKPFYTAILEPSLDALGFKSIFSQPEDSLKGMATFYKSSLFRLTGNSDISLKKLIEKEVEASSLDTEDRTAVKTHIKKCGNVLFAHLSTVIGTQSITVANVQIPPTDLSAHALQVSCMAREVVRINGGTNKPILLGGEFNIAENDVSYQLLRDGYLSNDMIEELQRRKDVALPGKENASLVNLLWKSFQHPSSNLCSCYTSVLDHEFFIPEVKRTSPDLLWYSSDSLHTIGVLDVVLDKSVDRHFSLKADVAFSV